MYAATYPYCLVSPEASKFRNSDWPEDFERAMPDIEYEDGDRFYIQLDIDLGGAPALPSTVSVDANKLIGGHRMDGHSNQAPLGIVAPSSVGTAVVMAPSTPNASGISKAVPVTPPSSPMPTFPMAGNLKEAIDLITAVLVWMGLQALSAAGLFFRLGMAFSVAGYLYVTNEKRWVRLDKDRGCYESVDEAHVVGFISDWCLSKPLTDEQTWLRDNIPQKPIRSSRRLSSNSTARRIARCTIPCRGVMRLVVA